MNKTMRNMSILFCVFCLSACGVENLPFSGNQRQSTEASAPPPATASAESSYSIAPLSPPGSDIRPPLPGQTGRPLGPDGLPVLEARGINTEQLFSEEIRDPDRRFDRLENAVIEIRRDLEALMPPIIRLIAVEKDINALVAQLETLLQEDTAPPPYAAPIAPPQQLQRPLQPPPAQEEPAMTAPQAPTPKASAPPPSPNGSPAIRQLRTGEHPDKTRIVLDASGPVEYRYDIDNQENLMVIELPRAQWSAPMQQTLKKSPVIASYNVYPANDGGGYRVVLQLKKDTKVINETTIRPNGNNNFRIVLDLEK